MTGKEDFVRLLEASGRLRSKATMMMAIEKYQTRNASLKYVCHLNFVTWHCKYVLQSNQKDFSNHNPACKTKACKVNARCKPDVVSADQPVETTLQTIRLAGDGIISLKGTIHSFYLLISESVMACDYFPWNCFFFVYQKEFNSFYQSVENVWRTFAKCVLLLSLS